MDLIELKRRAETEGVYQVFPDMHYGFDGAGQFYHMFPDNDPDVYTEAYLAESIQRLERRLKNDTGEAAPPALYHARHQLPVMRSWLQQIRQEVPFPSWVGNTYKEFVAAIIERNRIKERCTDEGEEERPYDDTHQDG